MKKDALHKTFIIPLILGIITNALSSIAMITKAAIVVLVISILLLVILYLAKQPIQPLLRVFCILTFSGLFLFSSTILLNPPIESQSNNELRLLSPFHNERIVANHDVNIRGIGQSENLRLKITPLDSVNGNTYCDEVRKLLIINNQWQFESCKLTQGEYALVVISQINDGGSNPATHKIAIGIYEHLTWIDKMSNLFWKAVDFLSRDNTE
jgi:hypothetical protein